MTLRDLNALDRAAFVATLGGVFEKSPWVAERAYEKRPFASLAALHRALVEVVEGAPEARRLELICAHPDLGAALELTESSKREQAGAGLDRLSSEEYARFHRLNEAYKAKFTFPFVLAVKGHTKQSILASFEARLSNDLAAEKRRALEEIAAIARFRLAVLVEE